MKNLVRLRGSHKYVKPIQVFRNIGIAMVVCFALLAIVAGNKAAAYSGYMEPGANTGDAHHIVLIYSNHDAPIWTTDKLKPYAAHYNSNGTYGNISDDYPDDWMYDTFLFLALKRSNDISFVETNNRFEPADKADWIWLLDRWFNATNGEIRALNNGVGDLKSQLSDAAHKKKVIIGIPYPNPDNTSFGDVDGDGISENLSTEAGRTKVAKWFIDETIARWNASGLSHLELSGFYWTLERIDSFEFGNVQATANYIHAKAEPYTFSWIPYWNSANASQWSTLGFDFAIQQPNLFFNRRILDEETRTRSAANFAAMHEMGVELEIDTKLFNDPGRYWAFMRYLDDGYTHGYMNQAVTGTYQEIDALNQMRSRTETHYAKIYDQVYQFLKGTYVPFSPSIDLIAPHNLSVVSGKQKVEIATADSDGINRVEFYVDGGLMDTRTTAPYRMFGSNGYWDTSTVSEGVHELKVVVYDHAGNLNTRIWNVDVYKALQNEGFENGAANWNYAETNAGFNGLIDTATKFDGSASYLLSLPTGTPTTAGQYAQISQQSVYRTPSGPSYTLQFRVKDSYSGSTANYHYKQVLVNGEVVWSQDVATDGTDWRTIRVNVTDLVANKNSTTITLRLYEQNGVSSFHANVWFDDVQLHQTLGNGDFEAYYWKATSNSSKFSSNYDTSTAANGRRSWKIAVPSGSSVVSGAYAGVYQPLMDIQSSSSYSVTFSHKDDYTGASGRYMKQLLVDDVVVWQADAASDGIAWNSQTVDVTAQVAGKTTANVEFRVTAITSSSNLPINVNVDIIRSTGNGISFHNYTFEEQDYHPEIESTTGAINWALTTAKYKGVLALMMSIKENTATAAGDYTSVKYDLRYVPNVGNTYLSFWQRDTRAVGTPMNYHKMQAYIDGVKVWEKDVASDGTAWTQVLVNITSHLVNKEHATLELRLYEQNPVTNLNVSTYWDEVKLVNG